MSGNVNTNSSRQDFAFELLGNEFGLVRDGNSLTLSNFGQAKFSLLLKTKEIQVKVPTLPENGKFLLSNTPLASEELIVEYERPAEPEDFLNLEMSEDFAKIYAKNPEALVYTETEVFPAVTGADESLAYAVSTPSVTDLRYSTFIPAAKVPAPSGVCTPIDFRTYFFLGDNRSWNVNATSYKTRMNVKINWLYGGAVTYSKAVQSTRRYVEIDGNLTFDEQATASTSSMHLRVDADSSSSVAFEMWQNVPNPLCNSLLTGGIRYDYFVAIERGGVYSVEGVAVKVPNHEFYVKDSDDNVWKTIFRRSHVTFDCLTLWAYDTATCLSTSDYYGVR